MFSRPGKRDFKIKPHHEITNIRELQPGQLLRGAGRGATAFYGVRGGWSGIATGYLLVKKVKLGFSKWGAGQGREREIYKQIISKLSEQTHPPSTIWRTGGCWVTAALFSRVP
jgi:hypothetical protein